MFRLFSAHALAYDRSRGATEQYRDDRRDSEAFLDQKTWTQAELARHCKVTPATIHKRCLELQANGIPLEDQKDHPHVYWSVPKNWYPGGVFFTSEHVTEMFRQLSRLSKSKARDQLVERILAFLPSPNAAAAVVPAETTAREEQYLPFLEDSANQKVALRFRYLTVNRGSESMRHASVHRVILGPPARFVATCHRTGTLKWFRVESVSDAKLDPAETFREADPKMVDAHLRASLDGMNEGGPTITHAFFVSDPDSRWVARNLLEEMRAEEVPGGIRVTLDTAAVKRLARFVVGLGVAAKPLTPVLEAEVSTLASGALASIAAK